MITINEVNTLEGKVETITIPGKEDQVIEAEGKLTFLPALIDTLVHFSSPGESWITGAQAAIAGGVTTVFDGPDNSPSPINLESLNAKKEKIERQLAEANIPLHYHLYTGIDKTKIESIGPTRRVSAGIHIQMEAIHENQPLERIFQLAAQENILLSVHAENFETLRDNQAEYENENNPAIHSKIHNRQAAMIAVKRALSLAEKFNTQLFIQNVSTKEEIDLIQDAKDRHILVFGGVSSHHLFLSEEDYAKWGTKIQIDPPVRTKKDQEALWKGIQNKTIDTINSGHQPHSLEEKSRPYGKAPSGVAGVETMLPLLLNASNEGKISLEQIVHTLRINPEAIFNLPHNRDVILVDLALEKEVKDEDLKTKCHWSPYAGRTLKGWPVYTILEGQVFKAA